MRKTTPIVLCVVALGWAGPGSPVRGNSPVTPSDRQPDKPPVLIVEIAAERFSFTPSEIRTTVGTTLDIRLTSDDTAHGFRIVGTDVNIEVPKRGRGLRSVTFTPERAGRYTFECSRLCGAGHSFMRGVIIVSDATGSRR